MQRRELLVSVSGLLAGGVFAGKATAEDKKPHPRIHNALMELRAARKDLVAADHDFNGHRVKALQLIDETVDQLEKALKHAKK